MNGSSAEIAWAAGLFEGEGTIHSNRDKRAVGLSMAMSDIDVMERFVSLVGVGYVGDDRRDLKNPKHKRMWRWQVHQYDDVLGLLDVFEPMLGERRGERARQLRADLAWLRVHCQRGHEKPPDAKGCAVCLTKTHCKRGHPLDGPLAQVARTSTGDRQCLFCRSIVNREYHQRNGWRARIRPGGSPPLPGFET